MPTHPIQRCQIHKARNVIERLPKPLHASVRRALRQAWELDDADKAERLLRNLARRLDQEAPGVAASILEGLDEMLTVNRLGLPAKLRRSLACTNSIENMMGTVRRVCRNVKRWRNAAMALRWTAAGMMEAAKGFRRLKAYKHLPVLRAALAAHQSKYVIQRVEHDAARRIASPTAMPASPTSTKSGASPLTFKSVEPVSTAFEPSLRQPNADIENWRPESGARNWSKFAPRLDASLRTRLQQKRKPRNAH